MSLRVWHSIGFFTEARPRWEIVYDSRSPVARIKISRVDTPPRLMNQYVYERYDSVDIDAAQ
jgi:hypothetical protein